jgi:hypothetical protein
MPREKQAANRYEFSPKRYEFGKTTSEFWMSALRISILIYF